MTEDLDTYRQRISKLGWFQLQNEVEKLDPEIPTFIERWEILTERQRQLTHLYQTKKEKK